MSTGFNALRQKRPAIGGQRMGVSVVEGGGHAGHGANVTPVVPKSVATNSLPYQPNRKSGYSVRDMLMHKGMPGNSIVSNPRTGVKYKDAEIPALGPLSHAGWDVAGMRSGGRIGSAAGAVGSRGTPTSQRGKVQRAVEGGAVEATVAQGEAAGRAAARQGAQVAPVAPTAPVVIDPMAEKKRKMIQGGALASDADRVIESEREFQPGFIGPSRPQKPKMPSSLAALMVKKPRVNNDTLPAHPSTKEQQERNFDSWWGRERTRYGF